MPAAARKGPTRSASDHRCAGRDHHNVKGDPPGRLSMQMIEGDSQTRQWFCQPCFPTRISLGRHCTHTMYGPGDQCSWCGNRVPG